MFKERKRGDKEINEMIENWIFWLQESLQSIKKWIEPNGEIRGRESKESVWLKSPCQQLDEEIVHLTLAFTKP